MDSDKLLIAFGYRHDFEEFRNEQGLDAFEVGRVIAEHKERYTVKTEKGEFEAEITGNMQFTAQSREDFPAVGDWVALAIHDADLAIIHRVFPRYSVLKRKAVAKFGEIQIIATNIDYAFVVQALDRDFNINRLERYITICNASMVKPIIILSKTDLVEEERVSELLDLIGQRIKEVPVIALSNETHSGYDVLEKLMEEGQTYCLLGSSGVGKSSLLNNLSGSAKMRTDAIGKGTNRGRHITSHRELSLLDNGSILIDNPGLREVGITDSESGLETTFDYIISLAEDCKFNDCTHMNEAGCAVLEAIENGDIEKNAYDNYLRMEREKSHFGSTIAERRKKEKEFGKMVKHFKNSKKSKRY